MDCLTRRWILGAAAVALLFSAAGAQDAATASAPAKPRVAVADFSITGDVGISEAGKAVSELLIAELGTSSFQIVERSQLTAVLEEHKLSMTEVVSNPALLAKHLRGVSHLITGSVLKLGGLSISARLVDVKTGDIVRTAKVSAPDAQGLEAALGELARKLQGDDAAPRKSDHNMTLELYAAGYGRMVWKGQSLRCGPKELAVFKDFPSLSKIQFLPDGEYKPGDQVQCVTEMVVGEPKRKFPAGTTATVVEKADMKDFTDAQGQVYVVKWKGMEDTPATVGALFIEPVKRTAKAQTVELSAWYRDRSHLRGVFLWDCTQTGCGVQPAEDAGLSARQRKEAAFLAAAADAVRRVSERALGIAVDSDPKDASKQVTSSSRFDFNGIRGTTKTLVRDFTAEKDTMHLEIPDAGGKTWTFQVTDFVLEEPAKTTDKGRGANLRDLLTLVCAKVQEGQDKDQPLITQVTLTYTGIVAAVEDKK